MNALESIRADFPILQREVQGKPLVYLDNAATTQKPKQVVEAMSHYYLHSNTNVGRSMYALSLEANAAYGGARNIAKQFFRAKTAREIVFTKSTTEAINLVASSLGDMLVGEGDEVLLTAMEHHGNLCPWQTLCQRKGASIRVAGLDETGALDMDDFRACISRRTKIIAVPHVSNVLGTVNPVKELVAEAHRHDIPILVDGAQAAAHMPVDVQSLDCDFYAVSGHKMYAPMGIGILYGKEKWLDRMPPYQLGGGIMLDVAYDRITRLRGLPDKFEAGTPNVGGAVALGAAMKYLTALGWEAIEAHERELLEHAMLTLKSVDGLSIYGNAAARAGVISFLLAGIHPYDIGIQTSAEGIAMRTGVHCAIPLNDTLKLPVGTVRASFGIYNTKAEIDFLADTLRRVKPAFWSTQKPNDRM